MKQEVSPVVMGVVIVLVVAVLGYFLWKGTGGQTGSKPPMAVGNPGPFAPGGAAQGTGGRPAGAGTRSSPMSPGGPAAPGTPPAGR